MQLEAEPFGRIASMVIGFCNEIKPPNRIAAIERLLKYVFSCLSGVTSTDIAAAPIHKFGVDLLVIINLVVFLLCVSDCRFGVDF